MTWAVITKTFRLANAKKKSGYAGIDVEKSIADLRAASGPLQSSMRDTQGALRVAAAAAVVSATDDVVTDLIACLDKRVKAENATLRQWTEHGIVGFRAKQESAQALVVEVFEEATQGADSAARTAAALKCAEALVVALAGLLTTIAVEEPLSPDAVTVQSHVRRLSELSIFLREVVRDAGGPAALTEEISAYLGLELKSSSR